MFIIDRYYSKSISRCSKGFGKSGSRSNNKCNSWSRSKGEDYRGSYSNEMNYSASRYWRIKNGI